MLKKEFTAEMIEGKQVSWEQVFHYYFPGMEKEEMDYLLWNETCFPFDDHGTLKHIYGIYLKRFSVAAKEQERSE